MNTNQADIGAPEPAGFWRRLVALFIDALIINMIPQVVFQVTMGPLWMIKHMNLFNAVMTLLMVLYYIFFLSSSYQATLGKRVMGVYVMTAQSHKRLTLEHAFARYVAFTGPGIVMLIFMIMGPNFPVGMFPKDQQQTMTHMMQIQEKMANKEPLNSDDQAFMKELTKQKPPSAEQVKTAFSANYLMIILGALSAIYSVVLAAMVAFTQKKTGIHDLICKTRAVKGRT